jgi:hypothetical protein
MADSGRGRGTPRQQEQRKEKLKDIKRQVASGALIIRKMTKAERKRFPATPRKKRQGRAGR